MQKFNQDVPPATGPSAANEGSGSKGDDKEALLAKQDLEQSQVLLALGAILSTEASAAVQVRQRQHANALNGFDMTHKI